MKAFRLSLRTKLVLSFLAVIVLGGLLSLFIGSRLIRTTLVSQAQAKVRHDLSAAWMVFNEKLNDIQEIVRLTSARESLRDLLASRRLDILSRYLSRVRTENGLDVLTLLDPHGRVLLRTRAPGSAGADLSSDPLVRSALGSRPAAAPRIVSREELMNEGPDLAERARMVRLPTPRSAPLPANDETSGMVLEAAAPVLAEGGAVAGVLVGGILLNRNYEIVDRVKGIVFKDEQYKGRETGTATIFQNDLRISTNVKNERGERAVGTLLSAEVKTAVLDNGQSWIAPAFVVNDWYLTAYEPIRDAERRIIGILYVGTLERPYLDTARRLLLTFAAMAGAATVFLLVILYFSTTRIIRPLRRMAAATRQIARGDLSQPIAAGSRDEVGALADSFNEMTSHLRDANTKLVEWGKTLERRVEERTRELGEIQAHLIQSERLASIGKLAAGIAHEINNPLGGILIYSHLLLEDAPPGHLHHENLEKIVRETTRCKDIVKGLLDFARPREPVRAPTNLHELLDRCLSLTERQALFQNIHIVRDFAPGLPAIVGDGDQLQQVFMNIIFNAAEAMAGNGTLTLRSSFDAERDTVAVAVADTGHGIPEEDKKRLFEPFFTTKEVGRGTGLGLAISYGIVQKHGGAIDVLSQPGRGTTFTVILPCRKIKT